MLSLKSLQFSVAAPTRHPWNFAISACSLATLGDSRCIFALAHLRSRPLYAALRRLERLEPQKCSQNGTNFRLTKVMYIPADMAVNPPHTPLRDSLIAKIAGKAVSAVAWHSLCWKGDVNVYNLCIFLLGMIMRQK
jgi:hypothetical protein